MVSAIISKNMPSSCMQLLSLAVLAYVSLINVTTAVDPPVNLKSIPPVTPRVNKPVAITAPDRVEALPPPNINRTPLPLPEVVDWMNSMAPFSGLGQAFPNNPPIRKNKGTKLGSPPGGRWMSSAVLFENKMYIYGGISDGTTFLNDLWLYNYNEDSWLELETATRPTWAGSDRQYSDLNIEENPNPPQDIPPQPPMALAPGQVASPKIAAAMQQSDGSWSRTAGVEMPMSIVKALPALAPITPLQDPVQNKEVTFIELSQRLQSKTKTHIGTTTKLPPYNGNRGGYSPQELMPMLTSSSVYVYDMNLMGWQPLVSKPVRDADTFAGVQPEVKEEPTARWMHTAVALGKKMIVFGGTTKDLLVTNEAWAFNLGVTAPKWTKLELDEDPLKVPGAREGHIAIAMGGNEMLIHGGMAQNYIPYGDSWIMDTTGKFTAMPAQEKGPSPRWMHCGAGTEKGDMAYLFGGATIDGTPLNDMYIFDKASKKWGEVTVFKGVPPPGRWLAAAVAFETAGGPVVVIHGGTDGIRLFDDMWIFNAKEAIWQELFSIGDRPYGRMGHTLTTTRAPGMYGIFRRYREFKALEDYLKRQGYIIPKIPPKSWLSNFEIEFIAQRREALQQWLNELLKPSLLSPILKGSIKSTSPLLRDVNLRKFFTDRADMPPPTFTIHASCFDNGSVTGSISSRSSSGELMEPVKSSLVAGRPTVPANRAAVVEVKKIKTKEPISLNSFHLIKVIGKGSFGKVMLVKKKDTGNMYAMKVLAKTYVVERKQIEHTRTERSVLGRCTHPFVVGMHYAFQTARKLYFVLGGELFFHLGRRGTFPENLAMFYTAEIVLALAHLHRIGVVYRDLKPENILIDHYGHVKLADFGLSKEGLTEHEKGTHSFCGTAEYLAPEILRRSGHGTAVDWWSLGMVLFEMLTGLPPWYTKDKTRLFHRVKNSKVRFPPTMSSASKSLISGLLQKDPKDRLGKGDAADIKSHSFFIGLNWTTLENRQVKPPFVPKLKKEGFDTSNFDSTFTRMGFSTDDNELAASGTFAGFTFDSAREEGLMLLRGSTPGAMLAL